jgi:phosphatidylglycerol:prolipoprotein diacylglycerol transferase
LQNFTLLCGVAGIALGFCSAILFQALYNIGRDGGFVISANTGATFYGGLIGGAASFLAVYFAVGYFRFKNGENKTEFWRIASCAAPSIIFAHAFGRIGCLMAGCCHGSITDSRWGILMHGDEGFARYVPIQLFEAIFLFALFALLFARAAKSKKYNLPIYMIAYGVWRFAIEFARGDYRGSTLTDAISPSQLIAILMVLGGIAVIVLEKKTSFEKSCGGAENE